jgi:hypothetical protein
MGSGFAFDAIKKLEYNRLLKQLHRARYNELKDIVYKIKAKYPHKFIDRSQLTDKELKTLKKKIKIHIIKDRQKSFIISLLITSLVCIAIYFIIQFLFFYFYNS